MGTATASDELRDLTARIANEYGLGLQYEDLQRFPRIDGMNTKDFEADFIAALETLEPGTYLFVEHPGYDSPELRAFGHPGYENVATHRAGVTKAFTSKKVKAVIKKRGIKLISYADLNP
jgi:chitin disaccharide deacetylase